MFEDGQYIEALRRRSLRMLREFESSELRMQAAEPGTYDAETLERSRVRLASIRRVISEKERGT